MKRIVFYLSLTLSFLFISSNVNANNIQITTVPVLEKEGQPAGYWGIKFDLSWDNSWRSNNPKNWDAAWIFAKYSIGGGEWKHVYLGDTNANTRPDAASVLGAMAGGAANTNFGPDDYIFEPGKSQAYDLSSEQVIGYFLYRAKNGYGRIEFKDLELMWKYTAQGVIVDDPVSVKVFAIEMVYIPQGAFYLGSGGAETYRFCTPFSPGDGDPYRVDSEDAIFMFNPAVAFKEGGTSGTWNAVDSNGLEMRSWLFSFAASVPRDERYISAEFPKGYNAFYMMKYEVTQEAYVDFLNSLTISQQKERTGMDIIAGHRYRYLDATTDGHTAPQNRCGVLLYEIKGVGTFVCNLNADGTTEDKVNQGDDGQNVAMCYTNVLDGLAYLSWSGLRPLTEFEFVKAARGTLNPSKNEYVWGGTQYTNGGNPNSYLDKGKSNEKSPIKGANVNMGGYSPARVGSFADSATNRTEAGAGYYGNMDLSGNAGEDYVTVSYAQGRAFKPTHGYGALEANGGFSSVLGWPYIDSYGYRWTYGSEDGSPTYMRLSDRTSPSTHTPTTRYYYKGMRGGRTAK